MNWNTYQPTRCPYEYQYQFPSKSHSNIFIAISNQVFVYQHKYHVHKYQNILKHINWKYIIFILMYSYDMTTHDHISTNIYFYPAKFFHEMIWNPFLPKINLNHDFNHMVQFYDHIHILYTNLCYPYTYYNYILNLLYDCIMVIKLNHMIGVMIEIDIWDEWILYHVV